jgi:serine protease Do
MRVTIAACHHWECHKLTIKARVRLAFGFSIVLAAMQASSGGAAAAAGAGPPPGYASLVQQVAPSVVSVLVEEQAPDAAKRAADRALERTADESDAVRAMVQRLLSGPGRNPDSALGGQVLGSGFVVGSEGFIVTNNHVVAGARGIRVRMSDSKEFPAEIVGTDAATDIALLRVKAGHLPALKLGSSERTAVGDSVIAIGNPYGLGQTVTAGIISARGRTLQDDPYIDFLQTDAAINRGNSGGPLLSTDGIVLGVTSAIFSPSGGSVGLGFAIPAEMVATVVAELKAHGHVDRGYFGISAQALTPAIATALGVKSVDGALITAVEANGPADKVLWVGDVLLSIGGKPVTFTQLPKRAARLTPGSDVNVVFVRDGTQLSAPFKVGRLPDPPIDPTVGGGADTWAPNLALGLADTTAEVRKALKAEDEPSGLIVTQLRAAGPGALAGLKIGDLITHAGTKHLTEAADLAGVDTPTTQQPLLLRVVREGVPNFVAVTGSNAH